MRYKLRHPHDENDAALHRRAKIVKQHTTEERRETRRLRITSAEERVRELAGISSLGCLEMGEMREREGNEKENSKREDKKINDYNASNLPTTPQESTAPTGLCSKVLNSRKKTVDFEKRRKSHTLDGQASKKTRGRV